MVSNKQSTVVPVAEIDISALGKLLGCYGLSIHRIPDQTPIPGSYWKDEEAGLIGDTLYVRNDTPLHSALHEASHYVCATPERRASLHTDAGSDDDEENATCFLQILLAAHVSGFSCDKMFSDMDAWGYSFRLGSARCWFEQDAEDARYWLFKHGVIDEELRLTWRLRQ